MIVVTAPQRQALLNLLRKDTPCAAHDIGTRLVTLRRLARKGFVSASPMPRVLFDPRGRRKAYELFTINSRGCAYVRELVRI